MLPTTKELDKLSEEAVEKKLDFIILVTSSVLGCEYEEVTPEDRHVMKSALWAYLYGR